MSVPVAILAAVAATLAGGIPTYPGATRSEVGGAFFLTTRDAPEAARAKYAEVLRKAGWKPSEDDAVLNGDVPGASPEQNAAVKQAGLLLSFERDGRTADILIRSGTDKRRRPVTMLMIIPGTVPGSRDPKREWGPHPPPSKARAGGLGDPQQKWGPHPPPSEARAGVVGRPTTGGSRGRSAR